MHSRECLSMDAQLRMCANASSPATRRPGRWRPRGARTAPGRIKEGEPMADYPDHAARAVRADERAERSEVADGWRNLARRYRALARQHTEMT
jgi:hypothetical protein